MANLFGIGCPRIEIFIAGPINVKRNSSTPQQHQIHQITRKQSTNWLRKNPRVQAVIWKRLSSSDITYKYNKSPFILRCAGGGFQPLVVKTFNAVGPWAYTRRMLSCCDIQGYEWDRLSALQERGGPEYGWLVPKFDMMYRRMEEFRYAGTIRTRHQNAKEDATANRFRAIALLRNGVDLISDKKVPED